MRLQFLGSGDAFGSGGRFHTCFLVGAAGGSFLIDCGASSMIAMRRFGVDPNSIGTIFVSHLHGDHFGGLPFMILDGQVISRRQRPLTIAGPPGLRDRLLAAMENFFPGSSDVQRRFALEIVELPAEQRSLVNGIAVTPYEVKHFSGAPPYALRLEVDGKVLCYSGDTEWVDSLIPAARGADLFISEAYFFDKKVKYHVDFRTLQGHFGEIGAKRVILTHMSQELLDRLGEVDCETAADGRIVEF